MRQVLASLLLACLIIACTNSQSADFGAAIGDIPRKTIDVSKLGVNAFANDTRFGSIGSQFAEIKNTLHLKFVRVLFAWNDGVQPSPSSEPAFGFYDEILSNIPSGMDVLVVLTGIPSWMNDSANWIDGNPRKTFVESWVKKAAQRYGHNGKIIGFEIWNEQNQTSNPDNVTLNIDTNPTNYVEMLALSNTVLKALAPGKKILNGATTAINQNFSDTLDYNKDMRTAGAASFVNVWNVHYYGVQGENVVRNGGVADFLNGFDIPIWVTESGAQGVNNQLEYGETIFPFLIDNVPSIERIYYYQFAEATPSDVTYGLRNLDPALPISDLYVSLRDRK